MSEDSNKERRNLEGFVRAVSQTRDEELSCDECFEQLDRFVELELSGLNAREAMPLVQDHLDKCGDCREEFKALLTALRSWEQESAPMSGLWSRLRRSLGRE